MDILDSMDDTTRTLFTEARLGWDAIEFLNSDLGRLLAGRAEMQIQEAKEALLEVDINSPKEILQLQNKAAIASQFVQWIAEAITNGDASLAALEEMDAED